MEIDTIILGLIFISQTITIYVLIKLYNQILHLHNEKEKHTDGIMEIRRYLKDFHHRQYGK